jgi:hypothetical protein
VGRLLDQAAREMMNGARLARPEQVNGEKAKRDFEARLDSTRALLAAQQRITQEKSAPPEAVTSTRRIEADLGAGPSLAAAGRYEEARPLLDRAYLTRACRSSPCAAATPWCARCTSPAKREEYDYELDRNDTHRMLITVLLAERKDAAGAMPATMQPFIDKAGGLRREAEAGAARRPCRGIRLLEDSTRELVRAIRAGGIYIPGMTVDLHGAPSSGSWPHWHPGRRSAGPRPLWLPLAKDGVHDPRNPGHGAAAAARRGAGPLPRDTAGNHGALGAGAGPAA